MLGQFDCSTIKEKKKKSLDSLLLHLLYYAETLHTVCQWLTDRLSIRV